MEEKIVFWEDYNPPADGKKIIDFEKKMGITLPVFYKKLFEICDGGFPLKHEFSYYDEDLQRIISDGIGTFLSFQKTEYGDITSDNLSPPEFFPDGLVSFVRNGCGDLICFDYRQGKDNPDPPIVFWSHGADIGKDVSFIASNFKEFIEILKESED